MLVLTRKSGQTIMIGEDVEITVLSIAGEKVRLGIRAPRNIPVFREEVAAAAPDRSGSRAQGEAGDDAPAGDAEIGRAHV